MKRHINRLIQASLLTASLFLLGCKESNSPQTTESVAPQTIQGPLYLYYKVQTSPSTTSGVGTKPVKVKALHFYDNYIVYETTESAGEILPVDKIRSLHWRR